MRLFVGERESRETRGGKWDWTRQVPACTLSPLRCAFLGQPSAATRPRCLQRNCQIKMNHLAHNGRGAYRGRAGPRRRLISAAHTAGANEAAGGSRIRARDWARAGAAQHGHERKAREHPCLFPVDRRQLPPAELPVGFYSPFPCTPKPGLPLPWLFPGGTFHAAPPAGETLFLPSPFPLAQQTEKR